MKFVLFIINPFVSGINSIININKKNALSFLYLWFIIFGIGFVDKNESLDSAFYIEDFYSQSHISASEYRALISDYFTNESNTKDIYTLTVNFIVSRFTNNYHWVFFVYSIVFGFFYTRCLKYLLPYFSKTPFFYILFLLFCFSNPIFNINGVRFWTAAWIGVYALFKILIEKNYYFFALLAVTPLVHGSFVFWIIVFIVALYVPKPQSLWTILYVLSFFVSITSSLNIVTGYSKFMPQYLSHMLWNYALSNGAMNKMAGVGRNLPLYVRILDELPNIMLSVLTIILIAKKKELEKFDTKKSLISVYLVLVTIVNYVMSVPSLGARFQKLTIPLLVFIWLYYYKKLQKINWVLYLVPIAYSYKILYWIRYMLSVTDLGLYIFPAPVTIFKYLFFS